MFNLRIDRSVSLAWRPVLNVFHSARRISIPILMYHEVGLELYGRHEYFETNTTPVAFRDQMIWLKNHGYSAISLDCAVQVLQSDHLYEKYVVITFDDGLSGVYTEAFPVMLEYGITATVFLVTDWVQQQACKRGKKTMGWNQVREMQAHGMSFGSHTVSHPVLKDLNKRQVQHELAGSKSLIEDKLGIPVQSFAYPYAFPQEDNDFISCFCDLLQQQGYQLGVTTIIGSARGHDNQLLLPRLPMNRWDDHALLQAKMHGAYDWLQLVQKLHRKFRKHNTAAIG